MMLNDFQRAKIYQSRTSELARENKKLRKQLTQKIGEVKSYRQLCTGMNTEYLKKMGKKLND